MKLDILQQTMQGQKLNTSISKNVNAFCLVEATTYTRKFINPLLSSSYIKKTSVTDAFQRQVFQKKMEFHLRNQLQIYLV